MGLSNKREEILEDLRKFYQKIYEAGALEGYDKGYEHGYEDGQKNPNKENKAAISDGFRKGSSKCATAIRKFGK